MKNIEQVFITRDATIEDSIKVIQESGTGIALVIDEDRHLIGTITDGDIRRTILKRIPISQKVTKILEFHFSGLPKPIVASVNTSKEELLSLMEEKIIRQVPLVDKDGRVVEIAILSELIKEDLHLPLTAVIMAGGKGKRLLPLTKDIPKPMLPLENYPIIERIIKQLSTAGIKKIYIATNYRAEVIMDHFGDGKKWGVRVEYLREEIPLGTAGALSLIKEVNQPTLVINGDILTQLNFHSLYDFHRFHQADMTVGVRIYEMQIPYGVIETEDVYIKNLVEKPHQACIVNAGIYLINPSIFEKLPQGRQFDMTELVEVLLKEQKKVVSFPIQEYWMDIGQPIDYEQAKNDLENGIF